ncbi:hypothetical protein S40288_04095 [Stachybotrys chartarum IBT 40288]|nr:hypothetical protein S40288_04095 [Stachybotrys chartarum IBT 40288]
MASLNLSINGASIKSSYNAVVNGPPPSSGSPTYAQWALFSVQAPLLNAFQDSGAKESILKVQDTGDGELADLFEDFNEGRIQFAFAKVKDPNSGLPKNILIAWCGGGVPERTKGYFTSHLAAVAKILHGYHVQITARSDSDLDPAAVMQKVADASGAKYSSGGSSGPAAAAPPPVKSKPVFTPTTSSAGRINPIVAARSQRGEAVDEDGWGADAPPVTRSEIQKVESAYKPTKVNMAELTSQKQEPSRYKLPAREDAPGDVVKGGYQPIGKVDIAAIRAQAQKTGDDRPTTVKGSYEPVGKVDIAAIRAKAQKPAAVEEPSESRPLSDRAAAFSQPSQSERLTSLPKPKVANKFGGASSFSGTKAPTPSGVGYGAPSVPSAAPVGTASRTFADQGGKTPAQLWAEKKAKERGMDSATPSAPTQASPISEQKSGSEWKSGYSGKKWGEVQPSSFGRPAIGTAGLDDDDGEQTTEEARPLSPPEGGVSSLKDRFKDAPVIGSAPAPPPASRGFNDDEDDVSTPPPRVPDASRPSGGFSLPGLPSRPPPVDEEEEKDDPDAYEPEPEHRESSPVRVALPIPRGPEPTLDNVRSPSPPPIAPSQLDVPKERDFPEEDAGADASRGAATMAAATAVAAQGFEPEQAAVGQAAEQGGRRAVVQYDYDKAEDNEIDLVEGQYVTNIDMVDEDWWMGTNSKGQSGLFPSNYVELVEDEDDEAPAPPPPAPAPAPAATPSPAPAPEPAQRPESPAGGSGRTATALYDYEAAEDNELSFPEDAKVTGLEFPDEDWWFGHYGGKSGLFPANYVQLDS